jgi:hypothetical protein
MTLSFTGNSCLIGYSYYRGTSGGLTKDQYAKIDDMSRELREIYSNSILFAEIPASDLEERTMERLFLQLNSLPPDKIKLFHLAHADCLYTHILTGILLFGDTNYARYPDYRDKKKEVIKQLALGTDKSIKEALRMMVEDIGKYCRLNCDTNKKNKLIKFLQVPAREFYNITGYKSHRLFLLGQLLLFSTAFMGMYFLASIAGAIAGAIVATVGVVQVINILVQYSKFLSANHTSHQYLEATLSASASAKLR